MFEFHVDDIPDDQTVESFIRKNTDVLKRIDKFKNFDTCLKTKVPTMSPDVLWESVEDMFKVHGWYGFLIGNFVSGEENRFQGYGGLSLTYNINHWQDIEPNCQTLGNMRYNLEDFFADDVGERVWDEMVFRDKEENAKEGFYTRIGQQGILAALLYLYENDYITATEYLERCEKYKDAKYNATAERQRGKNTYSDGMAYCYRTPASKHGNLGKFLDRTERTFVRGRIATLKYPHDVHWHTDESIFFNTRINIPIHSTLSCLMHVDTDDNYFVNDPGLMYCWDTEKPHKVTVASGTGSRTAIVAGISPWFDFDEKEQVWRSNEFYGIAHPHEMFLEGEML